MPQNDEQRAKRAAGVHVVSGGTSPPQSTSPLYSMIDLYYWTTPNGHKITLFLEEAGLEYRIKPINIGKGDQF